MLNHKREAYCRYIAQGRNQTDAARLAGYSAKSARVFGSWLSTLPEVRHRVTELQKERVQASVDAQTVTELVLKALAGLKYGGIA